MPVICLGATVLDVLRSAAYLALPGEPWEVGTMTMTLTILA